MEKTKVQGEGEIIARFSNGETAQVTTWLYGEGEYHHEDDRIDSYTVIHKEWWEVDENTVTVAYPDECRPEHEGTIEEILEFIDFGSIDWSER